MESKSLCAIFCMSLAAALSLGCEDRPSLPAGGGLSFCASSELRTPAPWIEDLNQTSASAAANMFDRLIEPDPESPHGFRPSLAESWEVSRDGLDYTFHLRDGVEFHGSRFFVPSRPMDSSDVVFSFEKLLRSDSPYYLNDHELLRFPVQSGMTDLLKSVTAPDRSTVVFRLHRPDPSFLRIISSDFAVIVSKEYADFLEGFGRNPDFFNSHPIGTGPFMFDEFRGGKYLRLRSFSHYWKGGGRGNVRTLVFDFTDIEWRRMIKLMTNECQVMNSPAVSDLEFLGKNRNTSVYRREFLNEILLAFNTDSSAMHNPFVREAIIRAIDRSAVQKIISFDEGLAGDDIIPETASGHDGKTGQAVYPFSIEHARQLITASEANLPLELTVWADRTNLNNEYRDSRLYQILRHELAEIGIKLKIIRMSRSAMRTHRAKGRYDLAIINAQFPLSDPSDEIRRVFGCAGADDNFSNFCDERTRLDLEKLRAEPDEAERVRISREIGRRAVEAMSFIPLARSQDTYVTRKNISGVKKTQNEGLSFLNTVIGSDD